MLDVFVHGASQAEASFNSAIVKTGSGSNCVVSNTVVNNTVVNSKQMFIGKFIQPARSKAVMNEFWFRAQYATNVVLSF